ncbi:hypothetical protein SORDD21_01218 [Streptococcus oralis]|uniref:Lipoprotein n=1 Tax=Streptococcus oralis TaxID=1303 RepID=A0A139PJH5_STROR|nr:hypothetical protein [Streptococcus oralis]KXT90494.1 hypothetical protein SORDD21_01218 [Streptococcus oralis]RXX21757.1 hypothetical protein DF216_04725 [Streptococcus oralis]
MRKKLVLIAVLLGVALLTLAGCSLKSSRQFIEGKASELSKVYPTENLENLFEKFPDGFQIRITDISEDSEDSPSISYQLVLNGISETKEIKGEITKESSFENSDGKIEEEILYQGHVYYKDGSLHLSEGNSSKNKEKGDLKHSRLLMQDFLISRSSLKSLEVVRKGYSFETGSASITYKLKNEQVNTYLGLENDAQINMGINIFEPTISGKSYGYSIIFRNDNLYHAEGIVGKLEKD